MLSLLVASFLARNTDRVDPSNVNIPWPTKGMGDADYMYAFQQFVMPIAQEFDPDLVMSKQPSRRSAAGMTNHETQLLLVLMLRKVTSSADASLRQPAMHT